MTNEHGFPLSSSSDPLYNFRYVFSQTGKIKTFIYRSPTRKYGIENVTCSHEMKVLDYTLAICRFKVILSAVCGYIQIYLMV